MRLSQPQRCRAARLQRSVHMVSMLGCGLLGCGKGTVSAAPSAYVVTASSSEPAATVATVATGPAAPHESAQSCAIPKQQTSAAGRLGAGQARLPLVPCNSVHTTGFYRDNYCRTGDDDLGVHVVCAQVTQAFLDYTRGRGNDLSTPRGAFKGLQSGDNWCLCAARWKEALDANVAPPVVLEATDRAALRYVSQQDLDSHQLR